MAELTDIETLAQKVTRGDRRALAKAITLTESSRNADEDKAQELLESLMSVTGQSIRIGISGVPGVGKSTFIETFGLELIGMGRKVAVLAVDPSSPNSGGSILGDKTRMQDLMASENAFIRPSPTSGKLGGVSRKTRESMLLCEAAGYDIILIETVGVGQSEYEVASMVDFFAVQMLPGAGDSLQGIKKGILELADMMIINKADGDNLKLAKHARAEYQNALKLLHPKHENYSIRVLLCSALEKSGIQEIWKEISTFINTEKSSGGFELRRNRQISQWVHKLTEEALSKDFKQTQGISELSTNLENQVKSGELTPLRAAHKLLEHYKGSK